MRRRQLPIDRNKIKTPRYLPTRPDVLMNSIWLNEVREHRETIEVITPIYSTTPEESPRAMSFNSRFPKSSGDFNTAAKANKELSELLQAVNTDHSFGDHDHFVEDYIYSQYYDDNRTADDTCYTVIDDRKANNSKDNQFDEIEVIERKDLPEWNTECDGNITTFEKDCDDSGRVIWIYSYKKNEDCDVQDYELGRNMPNTSTYLQDIAEEHFEYESGEGGRVATPVPSEYIPRLDFSRKDLTLPTVAEISEKSSDSQKSVKQEVMSKKSFNSWFSEFDKIDVKSEADSLEEKHVERTCSSVHKHVETERILMSDAETQANDKYIMKPLLKNRSEINTRTIGTQTELIMQCAHAKVLGKPVASNLTFVITDDDNVQDQNADVNSKAPETPKSRTGYEKSKKPIRFHSAPITTKLKHIPYSSKWQDGSIRRIARFRRKVLGNDELCCRKCMSCPDESTPHRSLNDSHSQGSQTCYCIKSPRKLSASVPPSWYDVSPVLDSLRTMHLSLGEDLDYDTMSWWQKLVRCVLCR